MQVKFFNQDTQKIEDGFCFGEYACPFCLDGNCKYCTAGQSAYVSTEAGGCAYVALEDVTIVIQAGKEQSGDVVFTTDGQLVGNLITAYGDFVAVVGIESNTLRYFSRDEIVICVPLIEALIEMGSV